MSSGTPPGSNVVERADIVLLHDAVGGLVLDRLTTPLEPDTDPLEVAGELARRILRASARG